MKIITISREFGSGGRELGKLPADVLGVPCNEKLSDKDILRNMKQIDKERMNYHDLLSETKWGDKGSYHLCINTSGREIKSLIPGLAEYAKNWFGKD